MRRAWVHTTGVAWALTPHGVGLQERYHSLAPMYYRGAQAAIVVYDVTSTDTFARAKTWVKELQRQANPNIVIALAGNKADLAGKRAVDFEVRAWDCCSPPACSPAARRAPRTADRRPASARCVACAVSVPWAAGSHARGGARPPAGGASVRRGQRPPLHGDVGEDREERQRDLLGYW